MNVRIVAAIGILVLLIGLAVTTVLSQRRDDSSDPSPSEPSQGRAAAPAPEPVGDAAPAEDSDTGPTNIGTLKGEEANIAAAVPGTISSIAGQVGARVGKGEVVVELDASDLRQQAEQARHGVAQALPAVEKAKQARGLKSGEIEAKVKEAEAGLEQARGGLEKAQLGLRATRELAESDLARARSGLRLAQANFDIARQGPRPEEVSKAEIALEANRKALEQSRTQLEKMRRLASPQAVAGVKVDQAQADFDKAEAQYRQAEETLKQVKAGAPREELRAAQLQVVQAREALQQAEGAGKTRVETAKRDVAAAELGVRNAERGVEQAKEARGQLALIDTDIRSAEAGLRLAIEKQEAALAQIEKTRLRSPLAGEIAAVHVNVGEVAGAGRPLVTVASTSGLHVAATVPSRFLPNVRAGRAVTIELDGARGKVLRGRVRDVSLVANPDGRSYPARIDVMDAAAGRLLPGARARVSLEQPAAGKDATRQEER